MQVDEGRRATGFVVRLGCFFAAIFLVAGVRGTYFPVWMEWRGLSAAEISQITAIPLLLRIVATPLIGMAADRYGDHRRVVIGLAWAVLVVIVWLAAAASFWTILLLTLLLAVASSSIMPMAETVAMGGLRSGLDYGRMRLWGSISFIAAGFVAGIGVEQLGPASVVPLMAVSALFSVLAAHALPVPEQAAEAGKDDAPRGKGKLDLGAVSTLLKRRDFCLFLLAVGSIQAAHAIFYTLGVLHWQKQGHSPVMISALWAIGVVTEIVLFAWSGAVVARVGAVVLIIVAGGAAVVRWTVTAFDPPLAPLLAIQVLHGFTYGAAHLGAVHYLAATVPREQAGTAQSLYATVAYGILLGLATLAAGVLYPAYGGRAYLAMAVLGAVGLGAALALRAMQREKI